MKLNSYCLCRSLQMQNYAKYNERSKFILFVDWSNGVGFQLNIQKNVTGDNEVLITTLIIFSYLRAVLPVADKGHSTNNLQID